MSLRPLFGLVFLLVLVPFVGAEDFSGRRVLGADRGRLAILDSQGAVTWEMPWKSQVHDMQILPDGRILTHRDPAEVVEIDPTTKQVVWSYVSKPRPGYDGRVEIHAVQRLADGLTMIAESGNRRIIEVDRAGRIVRSIDLKVDRPNAHRDTRLVRKLSGGGYLVCHELDGVVREYAPDGEVVWSYKLDLDGRPATPGHGGHGVEVFGAVRLENGNTLIATGNGNRLIEVDRAGEIVWSIGQTELPGVRLQWVTSLVPLPNGRIRFGNTHAGPDNPQLIEVDRDKRIVWSLKNHETFGNDMAAAIVLPPDSPLK